MNETNIYSDEHISAFIDGELDNDERKMLLIDEQADASLALRINEARMMKEKIQLAYSDLSKKDDFDNTSNCKLLVKRYATLVAGVMVLITATALFLPVITNNDEIILARQLMKNTTPTAADAISSAIGTNKQVVIDISRYQPQNFDDTINHIEALLQKNKTDKLFRVEIVASQTGLKALDTETSIHAERISQMVDRFSNFKVVACAKSLSKLTEQSNPIQLMKSIMITPSAVEQIAKRTSDGWFYLKL